MNVDGATALCPKCDYVSFDKGDESIPISQGTTTRRNRRPPVRFDDQNDNLSPRILR